MLHSDTSEPLVYDAVYYMMIVLAGVSSLWSELKPPSRMSLAALDAAGAPYVGGGEHLLQLLAIVSSSACSFGLCILS
jgi:hypothetical protein